jgi:hypothetical protein
LPTKVEVQMSTLTNYIAMVEQEWESDQLFEMAKVTSRRHGIENVVIWVGMAPKNHGLRVKVSNIPGKMDMTNSFVIMMPMLDYDPAAVADWITPRILKQVIEWIKLNQQLLHDYETGAIIDTDDFLNRIVKV